MSPTNIPLWARNTVNQISSAPSTFSSWNSCMSKAYCKWPVIIGIIIVSVIVIAVLGCIINCLCCGYRCCTTCCGCFCPSGNRRRRQPKYYDEPAYHQPPPTAAPIYQPNPAPPAYRGTAQTARFDAPKSAAAKANEDALPAMPTWDSAIDKHVEDTSTHGDDVEMEPLNPHGQAPDRHDAGTPMQSGAAYAEYPPDHSSSPANYRGYGPDDPYGRRSPGPAAAFTGQQDPYGRRSPGAAAALGNPQDPYGRHSPGPSAAFAGQDPYDRRSPGVASPGAAADPYGRRSPALAAALGAPATSPYNQPQAYQQPHGDYSNGSQFHANTSPSPVAAYKPNTQYSPVSMPFTPSSEMGHRAPSIASSQYPPSYTSQPQYRGASAPMSPPPPFPAPSPSVYTTHDYNPQANRTPSLLQSGRRPAPNSYRAV